MEPQINRRGFLKVAAATAVTATIAKEAQPVQAAAKKVTRTTEPKRLQSILMDYLADIEIIDSHEHLAMEKDRIKMPVDALTLVGMYNYVDIQNSGMPHIDGEGLWSRNYMVDSSVPLKERWERVWPYLQDVKHGSYNRAAKIAMKHFYGIDDLNPKTYMELTERMRANNTKGLYKRVMRDACHIRTSLVQNGQVRPQDPDDLLTPVLSDTINAAGMYNMDYAQTLSRMYSMPVATLGEFLAVLDVHMAAKVKEGAVGFKLGTSPMVNPDWRKAGDQYLELAKGGRPGIELQSSVWDYICKQAAKLGKPLAVHTGVWGDYRTNDPKLIMDAVMHNPETQFDVYHMGFPYTRDFIFLIKNNPNAYADLCWSWIVSPTITREAVNELLDLVPVNKVTAFGADYSFNVECVYGHLQMAKEGLAEAFAQRIARGWMDIEEAQRVLKMWLFDNPTKLYQLS